MDRNFGITIEKRDRAESLSARRAWIEIRYVLMRLFNFSTSLSARRAWIEIFMVCSSLVVLVVALRKESVDRNIGVLSRAFCYFVALRKESVDRNDVIRPAIDVFLGSLSARRAWIEIQT